MFQIFIFYALIEEGKGKQLSLQGPFIHYKPAADGGELAEDNYLFDKEEYKKEKSYLSKMLREKYQHRISIFYCHDAAPMQEFSITCPECDTAQQTSIESCGKRVHCRSCHAVVTVPTVTDIRDKARQRAMFAAEDYFKGKFEQLKNNYAICNRKR